MLSPWHGHLSSTKGASSTQRSSNPSPNDAKTRGHDRPQSTYRRPVRQRQDLAALLWLQAMPTAPEPTLMSDLADAFVDLQFFYGSPLSDAALRRFIRQLLISLADLPLIGAALRTCDCAVCIYTRKGVPCQILTASPCGDKIRFDHKRTSVVSSPLERTGNHRIDLGNLLIYHWLGRRFFLIETN